mmetsp:Transcript_8324/g.16441  ORF Transcript_8324/g.16441 Transcript_8324/m.16441 type:complete len:362 (-) Transcript_8324:6013-7098(-)
MSQGIADKLVRSIEKSDLEDADIYVGYLLKLLKDSQDTVRVRTSGWRRKCLQCKKECRHEAIWLQCIHGFCSVNCFKEYCLSETEQSLGDIEGITCKVCMSKVQGQQIVDLFGGLEAIERIKREANDAKLKALLPEVYESEHKIEFQCQVCQENFPYHKGVILSCKHRFCLDDFNDYVEMKIGDNQVSEEEMLCMIADCKTPIGYRYLREYTPRDLFSRYEKLLANLIPYECEEKEMLFLCPGVDCKNVVVIPNGMESFTCNVCGHTCCPSCKDIVHKGSSCVAYREWKALNDDAQKLTDEYIKANSMMNCPVCSIIIERTTGCRFMKCSSQRCNNQTFFCYDCKRHLQSDHQPHDCGLRR